MKHFSGPPSTNPFEKTGQTTAITLAFGGAGAYQIYTDNPTPNLRAVNWNHARRSQGPVTLMNGDTLSLGPLRREQAAVSLAIQMWASVANIKISQTNDCCKADLRFLMTDEKGMKSTTGEAGLEGFSKMPYNDSANYNLPFGNYTPNVTVINNQISYWTKKTLSPGGDGFWFLMHEIGHQFGLDHP